MRKKWVMVGVVTVMITVTWLGWRYITRSSSDNGLTLYGNVDIRQVSLAFTGSDRVATMQVEEGDKVSSGQVLATLDTQALRIQIQQADARVAAQSQAVLRLKNGSRPQEIARARSQVLATQADVDLALQQYKRLKDIARNTKGKAISKQDMDSAFAKLRVAQAQLDDKHKALQLAQIGPRKEDIAQAEAQLAAARAQSALLRYQLSQAELRSPVDAVVRARLLEPGDMASPQRPAYTLAITEPKWVRAYVTEAQLGYVKAGQKATVTIDSYPDKPIVGQVGYISSVAEFTPKNVETAELRTSLVYEIRVLVSDPQNWLRLGMPATVHIAAKAAQ